jgi:hypothetical protein
VTGADFRTNAITLYDAVCGEMKIPLSEKSTCPVKFILMRSKANFTGDIGPPAPKKLFSGFVGHSFFLSAVYHPDEFTEYVKNETNPHSSQLQLFQGTQRNA